MTPVLFSVSYTGYWSPHKLGLIPFLEKTASLSYPAAEIGAKRPHLSVLDDPDEDSVCEVKATANRLGVEIATLAADTDFTSGRQAAEVLFVEMQILYVQQLARLVKALGAKIVRVFSRYFPDLAKHQSDWQECVVPLRERLASRPSSA